MKKLIDKLALIEIKNKKILMTVNIGKSIWLAPGGQREKGESDKQTLIREIQEELNVTIIPETIKYYKTFEAPSYDKPNEVTVRYTCYTASYHGKPKPGLEIEKIAYFGFKQYKVISTVDKVLFDNLKEKGLLE